MSPRKKWYLIHTYSGHEHRVRDALRQSAERSGLADEFGEILIPTKPALSYEDPPLSQPHAERSLPGFLFVEMEMSEQAWRLVKETPQVTGFIGNQAPQEIPLSSIERLRPRIA